MIIPGGSEIIIIGGGIVGCVVAYMLRRAGHEVLLLERDRLGSGASGAAAGLLAPFGPINGVGAQADLLLQGLARLESLLPEVEDESGIQTHYARTGALRVVFQEKRIAKLRKRWENWQPLGWEMYWLTGEEARQQEPCLHPDVCAGIFIPDEAQLDARATVQAFAQAARQREARIEDGQEVCEIIMDRHEPERNMERVHGVRLADGRKLACDHLIIATGAWSQALLAPLAALPITPVRGQMLILENAIRPLRHLIFGYAAYAIPHAEGVLVGATREEVGFTPGVTDEGQAWLKARASRLLPNQAGQSAIRAWSGLRPMTPDTRPLIGPVPGWTNLLLATGHNSVGFLLSALTAEGLRAMLEPVHSVREQEVLRLLQPCLPQRFLS
ncbi:glycine oxidase ThiO [Ktedonobacter robiniae]|uniref:glycine oxidase n=1 Tax=Ktedonobacter robiniae TaxID=2778365 RepID=A0ABQ3UJM0_9CHLR|nr:glycine oxidase ThiO [Ktedonobacter robiniae]GHO52927.1 glycine oxidase ThiO [Ktedonobacter robiniae]